MMFSNNNKKVINKISIKSLKSNRMRNAFAIVAIILTCLLFTTLFTVGLSVVKSMELQTMRMVGTSAHCGLKYLTYEEFEKVKEHPLIKEYGMRIVISHAANIEFQKRAGMQVQYNDAMSAKKSFLYPTTGKMPQKYNEVVVDTKTLDCMELPHEIGQEIVIDYSIGDNEYSENFIVSGFFETDEAMAYDIGFVLVSKDFVDKSLEGIDISKSRKMSPYTGAHFIEIVLDNSNNIEDKINQIKAETIGDVDAVKISVNWGYMSTNFSGVDPVSTALITIVLITILMTGYFIINNIFQISIVNDIRYYGLMKAVGTTSRQIKSLVRRQMILLCALGIPIGLALGYMLGIVVFPLIMSTFTISTGVISYNPLIFVFATVFTLLTVYISTAKPCKVAGKVSPIEATRYNANISDKSKSHKSKSGNIYSMAWRNIFRNKPKTFSIIASLFLSLLVLMIVGTVVDSFDDDSFVSMMSPMDFSVGHNQYFSVMQHGEFVPVSKTMVDTINTQFDIAESEYIYNTISSIDVDDATLGILREYLNKEVADGRLQEEELKYFDNQFKEKIMRNMVYGIDKLALETLPYIGDAVTNEQWITGEYAIGNGFLYNVGDTITIKGDKKEKQYTIIATLNGRLTDSLGVGYSIGYAPCFYVPTDEFTQLFNAQPMKYAFNVSDEDMQKVNDFIDKYTKNIEPSMNYTSKIKHEQEYEDFIRMFKVVGYILSGIVALIGICNFINSIMTSIVVRRREFACLESIGMVKKQLHRLLMYEGMYYAICALALTVVLGQPFTYLVVNAIGTQMWFFNYNASYMQMLLIAPILIVLSMWIPIFAYRRVDKYSIIERLRMVF